MYAARSRPARKPLQRPSTSGTQPVPPGVDGVSDQDSPLEIRERVRLADTLLRDPICEQARILVHRAEDVWGRDGQRGQSRSTSPNEEHRHPQIFGGAAPSTAVAGSGEALVPSARLPTGDISPTKGSRPIPGGGSPERAATLSPTIGTSSVVHADMAGEDPWADILAQSSGDFCCVPVATLEHLRQAGEAQLQEIADLRRLLASAPEMEAETRELEARLEELEIARVVAENEVELRRQEASDLAQEAVRLRAVRDSLKQRNSDAQMKIEQLQAWLDPETALSKQQLSPKLSGVAATAEARLHARGAAPRAAQASEDEGKVSLHQRSHWPLVRRRQRS